MPLLLLLIACTGPKSDDSAVDTNGEAWYAPCPLDEAEQRLMPVGDITLNVACRGDGPVVLMLHGFPEFHHAWADVMDRLAEDFRLIAPDQRGYNLSDKPEPVEAYHLPVLAEDMKALIPLVSREPVLVLGHDWGGPVAWMLAHDPEAPVRGVYVANGPHPMRFAQLMETDPEQQSAAGYMDFFRREGAEEALTPEVLAGYGFEDMLSEADLALYMQAWSQPGAVEGGLKWYRANLLTVEASTEAMAGVSATTQVPVRVAWGLEDTSLLPVNAEGLEEWVPDLEVEWVEGADHWIEHRAPEVLAAGVRALQERTE